MSEQFVHSVAMMGTVVTFQVVGHGATGEQRAERSRAVGRAEDWFRRIEACCTRFDPGSEVCRLSTQVETPTVVSEILLACVTFALALAEESDGAFDPTVGRRMEARGFDREFRSGATIRSPFSADDAVSFRDVQVDEHEHTITLARPIVLDLGAVAKGFAIDLAATELRPFENFAVDAGGDVYLGGRNPDGEPWSVGIRHPRRDDAVVETLHVSNVAVCTSGDYEQAGVATGGGHHIWDPRAGHSPSSCASVTVTATSAMLADGLSTAAFVLGPSEGMALIERHGAEAMFYSQDLHMIASAGFTRG